MKIEHAEGIFATIITGCLVTLVACIAYTRGHADANREMQEQLKAVERGAAHWETASDGSTTFTWNEEPTE